MDQIVAHQRIPDMSKHKTLWSDEEVAYLKANYGRVIVTEIAVDLNRSATSIRTKAHHLNLSRTQNVEQRWSREVNPFGLSDREIDIIRSMAEGRSAAAVGAHLNLAESSVDSHMKSIRRRMGVYSSVRMVLRAERAGLLKGIEA